MSYTFYAIESWHFLPVLLFLTVTSFLVAKQLSFGARHRTAWLWTGLGVNLAALSTLRYAYRSNPFAGPFVVTGLSFYSLQSMSYLLDTYAGTLTTRSSLREVALYLAYFPKLVAGPIERARTFLPRLRGGRVVNEQTMARAATLICIGLTRKLVIADPLRGTLPQVAFSSPAQLSAAVLVATIIGYAFVLYNDFAAYTDMARGVSSLFGIELSENFAQPFFARSFSEFWNRWNITLSYWLRDYIYLPLSRALLRRKPSVWNVPNLLLPPLVTMLAGGLWHGSSAHMLLWGGLHGVYLIVEHLHNLRVGVRRGRLQSPMKQVANALVVFVLGSWALVAFRTDISTASSYWWTMLSRAGGALPDSRMVWYIAPSLWLDWMERHHGAETTFNHWPRVARAALLALGVLLWFLMTRQRPAAPFIYRGF
jgi:alginate O-acetyltransferase complex protein AlgI